MDKSPSLRAIAYDFNKLAQDVKEDTQLPELLARNNGAIENELIASGVTLDECKESNAWRNVRVFWKRMKDRMQDSDEYRRWLHRSLLSSVNPNATAIVPATGRVSAAPTSNAAPSSALEQEDFANKVAEKVATTLGENINNIDSKLEATQQTLSEQGSLTKSVYEFVTTPGPRNEVAALVNAENQEKMTKNQLETLEAENSNALQAELKERMLMNVTGFDTKDPAPPKESKVMNLQDAAPDLHDKVGGEDGAAGGLPVSRNDESKLALDTTDHHFDNTTFKVGDHVFDKKRKSSCLGSISGFYADSDDAHVSWDCGKVWDAKSRHNIANLKHASSSRRNRHAA
jgi:hypothetical protein